MSRTILPAVVGSVVALWLACPARAEDGASPQLFADNAVARSQVYEGFVAIIDGFQNGGGLDAWATEYIDAALGVVKGTVETIKYVTFLSIPTGALEFVMFLKGLKGEIDTLQGMYDDITTLMDNWTAGFEVGDEKLIWTNGFMFYEGKATALKDDFVTLQGLTAAEAVLWEQVAQTLLTLNDLEAQMQSELAVVEDALPDALFMFNTASYWKEIGSVPNTFVCQFPGESSCQHLVDVNHAVTKTFYDFLLSEQAYLTGFLAAFAEVEVECNPGESMSAPCGFCGTATSLCTDEGKWPADPPCDNPGECTPGTVAEQGCGKCGKQARTCDQTCLFGDWSECMGETGECLPGEYANLPCGDCGLGGHLCLEDCTLGPEESCDDPGLTWCEKDEDGDGFGGGLKIGPVCWCEGALTSVTGDCDDTDPAVNPDADETCNGHDDDCDGETDESGCPPADEWADVLIPQPDASPDAADGSDLPSAPDAASPDASASDPASELPAADNVAADSSATDATTPDSSSGGSGCGLSRSPSPGLPPLLAALLALALLAHARPRSR